MENTLRKNLLLIKIGLFCLLCLFTATCTTAGAEVSLIGTWLFSNIERRGGIDEYRGSSHKSDGTLIIRGDDTYDLNLEFNFDDPYTYVRNEYEIKEFGIIKSANITTGTIRFDPWGSDEVTRYKYNISGSSLTLVDEDYTYYFVKDFIFNWQ